MLSNLFPYWSDSVCKSNNFLIKSSLFFWYVRTLAQARGMIPMLNLCACLQDDGCVL